VCCLSFSLIDHLGNACVADFGLLKHLVPNGDGALEDSKFVGTLLFLSPERVASQPFSFPSDIYAVGLSLIFLATGALRSVPTEYWALLNAANAPPPCLPAESADGLTNSFSPALRDFISCMMARDPAARLTATELLAHPWLTVTECDADSTAADPLDGWAARDLTIPDPDELHTLMVAVVQRWYLPASMKATTAFVPTSYDIARFAHLASQMGWREADVIDTFVEYIRAEVTDVKAETIKQDSASNNASLLGLIDCCIDALRLPR
jgi:serine/threonine protein kinase